MKLGDLVYFFTKYTGIRWLVKKITKMFGIEDCGCDKRREQWNEIELNFNRREKWINQDKTE